MSTSQIFVGAVEVIAVPDATVTYPWPLEQLYPGVADWEDHRSRHPGAFASATEWRSAYTSYVVRSAARTILMEAGMGPAEAPLANVFGTGGHLLDRLGEWGISPADIDTVVLSHLHPDHVGWNLRKDEDEWRPTFPNAQYLVHRADWDAFHRPEVQAHFPFSFVAETITPLGDLGVLHLLDGEHRLTNDLLIVHTPGHTPGHISMLVAAEGEQAMLLGDVVMHPLQVSEPDRNAMFDMDPDRATATRKELLTRIADDGMLAAVRHFPEPGFGHVVREGERLVWQQLPPAEANEPSPSTDEP